MASREGGGAGPGEGIGQGEGQGREAIKGSTSLGGKAAQGQGRVTVGVVATKVGNESGRRGERGGKGLGRGGGVK